MSRLLNKTAIVTGAASGIGRGIAECFVREGAKVMLADVNFDGAERAAREISEFVLWGAEPVEVDVTSNESVTQMVKYAIKEMEHIDILVNAAGVSGEIQDNYFELSLEEIMENTEHVFDVNLFGLKRTTRVVGAHMKERRSGVILNIASIVAHGHGDMQLKHAYNDSKVGVWSFTRYCMSNLAPNGVRFNSISPGLIWTELWVKLGMQLRNKYPEKYGNMTAREIFDKWVEERVPLKRAQTPEDVGAAAVFLASDEARNITGVDLPVDGGVLAR